MLRYSSCGFRLNFDGDANMEDEMLNSVSAATSQKTHCLYVTNSD